MNSEELSKVVVKGMEEKKAEDIIVMDLRKVKGSISDFFIICSGNSDTQIEAIAKSIEEEVEKQSAYLKKIVEFKDYLLGANAKNNDDKLGYFDVLNMTISLMTKLNEQRLMENFPPDVVINISHETCALYDFYRAEELVAIGRKATENALSEKQQQSAWI